MNDLEEIRRHILEFLDSCRQPVLKEPDGEPFPLASGHFTLDIEKGRLLLQAWNDRRSVVRRITRLRRRDSHTLALTVQKFGGGESTLTLADTAVAQQELARGQARKRFRERFRKLLAQQFPGWKIERLSAERDLKRTFSERFTRAALRQGQTVWAAVGVSEGEGEAASSILTDGLLWLDHLRRQSDVEAGPGTRDPARPTVVTGLHLFVPEQSWQATANRLAFLDPARASYRIYKFTRSDATARVEESDYGNLRSELAAPRGSAAVSGRVRELVRPLAAFPGVEEEITADGGISLRYHGLEFARAASDTATFLESPLNSAGLEKARKTLQEILRIRAADSPSRNHPFYTRAPERWMESAIRADVSVLSADLEPVVYSQVLSAAGPARGVMDLVGVTRASRLVVVELKADEDPQLPLQALDYWMRVKWHLERGDFQARGYFRGLELSRETPLLWLISPSIRLHSTNEIVLRYFSPAVPVTWLGLNEDWRKRIRVVSRT